MSQEVLSHRRGVMSMWGEKPEWVRAWEKLPVRRRLELLEHYADGYRVMLLSDEDNFGDLPQDLQETLRKVFGGAFFIVPDRGDGGRTTSRRR